MLGMNEIVIIVLAIVLLLVGAKKIPELARAFGRAMGEFKRGKIEIENEIKEMEKTPAPAAEKTAARAPAAAATAKP